MATWRGSGVIYETEPEVIDRRYRAIGGAAELFRSRDDEVLCESGAMTGKSHSLLRHADYTARGNPGCRLFFARDTRKSMTESILVEFEEAVLWPGHPAIVGTAQRAQRSHYVYPNGSEIVLFGLDDPGDHMSTQYDKGYVFEATQVKQEAWEHLLSRMRNGKTDAHQLIADCNPGPRGHWLNQRFPKEGEPNPQIIRNAAGQVVSSRRRICYRHEDNPRLYDPDTGRKTEFGVKYIDGRLGMLTGARLQRLRYHRWVSEEGQVWPEYDPAIHCIYPKALPELLSFTASFDFGYNAPGCLQIWGYDKDQSSYRVAEVYRRRWTIDQWSDVAIKLHRIYPYSIGVADAARPDDIAFLNKRIRAERGESFGWIPCDKSRGVLHGLDLVRDLFKRRVLFLVKDAAIFGIDEELRMDGKPTGTESEIDSYVFRKNEEGREIKDEPDPACADHGCDSLRYNCVYKWGRDINPTPQRWDFKRPAPNELSVADAMGFLEVAEKEEW